MKIRDFEIVFSVEKNFFFEKRSDRAEIWHASTPRGETSARRFSARSASFWLLRKKSKLLKKPYSTRPENALVVRTVPSIFGWSLRPIKNFFSDPSRFLFSTFWGTRKTNLTGRGPLPAPYGPVTFCGEFRKTETSIAPGHDGIQS